MGRKKNKSAPPASQKEHEPPRPKTTADALAGDPESPRPPVSKTTAPSSLHRSGSAAEYAARSVDIAKNQREISPPTKDPVRLETTAHTAQASKKEEVGEVLGVDVTFDAGASPETDLWEERIKEQIEAEASSQAEQRKEEKTEDTDAEAEENVGGDVDGDTKESVEAEEDLYGPMYSGRSIDGLSAAGRPLVTIKKHNISPLRPPEEVELEEIVFTQSVDGSGLGMGPIRLRAGVRDHGVLPLSLQISEMVYIRTFVIALLLIFLLFMTYYLSPVLTPILFSLGVAYLLNPLVVRMEKLGISRSAAISMFVLLLVVLLVSVVLLLLPALSHSFDEFARLMQQLPTALNKLKVWAEVNFKFHFPKNFTEAITQWGEQIQKYVPSMVKPLTQFFSSIFLSGVTLLIALFNFLFIPLFTFYFLKDYKHVEERVVKSIPPRMRGWALGRLREIDQMISGFIRGQITVSMIVGSCYMIVLSAVQVPMAPAIALLGALINVIPYLGFFITYLIALTVALIQFQLQWQFFIVLIGMFTIHMCDVFVFTPKVVGEHTGMSELVVMIAILVGGKLFGIVGILLAVPMAAVVKVFLREALSRYEGSHFFRGEIEEKSPPTG